MVAWHMGWRWKSRGVHRDLGGQERGYRGRRQLWMRRTCSFPPLWWEFLKCLHMSKLSKLSTFCSLWYFIHTSIELWDNKRGQSRINPDCTRLPTLVFKLSLEGIPGIPRTSGTGAYGQWLGETGWPSLASNSDSPRGAVHWPRSLVDLLKHLGHWKSHQHLLEKQGSIGHSQALGMLYLGRRKASRQVKGMEGRDLLQPA